MLTLGLAPILNGALIVLFLVLSVVLVLLVLIQRPQGGGLGGAFGGAGAGSGQTAFGTKTGDFLTWATVTVFAVWLVFAIGLNFAMRPSGPAQTTPEVQSGPDTNGETGAATPGEDDLAPTPDAADPTAPDPTPLDPPTAGDTPPTNEPQLPTESSGG